MYTATSRYADAGTYEAVLADGSIVAAVHIPLPVDAAVLGWHRRREGERIDHLAHNHLDDATQGWRLADANGVIAIDALAARPLVAIPRRER